MSIFPSHDPSTNAFAPIRTPLQFSLLLSSTIDVFDLRAKQNAAAGVGLSGDVGLLHAVDDRLAAYGFETNTGVRMVCVVDMRGRRVDAAHAGSGGSAAGGGAGGWCWRALRTDRLKHPDHAQAAAPPGCCVRPMPAKRHRRPTGCHEQSRSRAPRA